MNDQIEVIGNVSSIIDYNLNSQYCDVKKIIISNEEILSAFEDTGVSEVFNKLSNSTKETYRANLDTAINNGTLDSTLSPTLYKLITENLSSISDTIMDIQLQGYNFMNSVSNSKFTIAIRCEAFSISKNYEERGSFLSSIRSLIVDYLEFSGNIHRLSKLKNFQFEIYESEEVHKHVFLKKDGSSLILASSFGFPKKIPVDFTTGSEFYYSNGEGFNFFRNSQTTAILKEHSKLAETSIQTRDKILSDDELIKINNATKSISDAVIELYLTRKGKLKILNVGVLESSIEHGTENGFYINKSTKNYNRISLVSQRDDLSEELPNPKYLLLRNSGEIQNFLSDLTHLNYLDGIVLTENLYIPLLDNIGSKYDLDVIFHKNELNKSLDTELNSQTIIIGNPDNAREQSNPFSNIISEQSKEKDEYLERLKSIDLTTPQEISQSRQQEQKNINQITTEMIASENSTMNQYNSNSYNSGSLNSEPGKRLSALDMLANAALNKDSLAPQSQQQQPAPTPLPQSTPGNKLSAIDMLMHAAENKPEPPQKEVIEQPQTNQEQYNQQQSQPEPYVQQEQPQQFQEPQYAQQEQEQPQETNYQKDSSFDQYFPSGEVQPQANQEQPQQFQEPQYNNQQYGEQPQMNDEMQNREIIEEVANNILEEEQYSQEQEQPQQFQEQYNQPQSGYQQNTSQQQTNYSEPLVEELPQELVEDIKTMENTIDSQMEELHTHVSSTPVDVSQYDEILTTKIVTLPNVQSSAYFVDSSNLGEITSQADLFFLTPTDEDLTNDSLNYVIPMGVSESYSNKHNYIVNSTNDYFLLELGSKLNLFINLSYIDDSIKKNFLEKCLKHSKSAYVVIQKQDIHLVEEFIHKIEGIFVKDLESQEELSQVEFNILKFEKKYLMKKYN